MDSAIKPTSLNDFGSISEEETKEIEVVKNEEDSLAFVARTKGWEDLVKFMDTIIEELDQMVVNAMHSELSFEEIGKRTLVKELTKDAIKRIRTKVEDAREASDRRPAG